MKTPINTITFGRVSKKRSQCFPVVSVCKTNALKERRFKSGYKPGHQAFLLRRKNIFFLMRLLLFIVFLLITLFSIDVSVRWPRIFFYLTFVFPTFRSIPLRLSHHCCKEEDLDVAIYSVFEDVTLVSSRQPCRLTRTKVFYSAGN